MTPAALPEASSHPATVAKSYRGDRARPKSIYVLPVDVLFEIFGVLRPFDLLALARTTKGFRKLLMNKHDTQSIWKAAREAQDGLPDIPPNFSEPAYASLLFSYHCHHCGKEGDYPLFAHFLARYCPSCEEHMLTNNCESFLPSCANAMDVVSHKKLKRGFGQENILYHKPELESFMNRWKELEDDTKKEEFIEQCKTSVNRRLLYVKILQPWADGHRAKHKKIFKRRRLGAIKERLRDETWSEDFDRLSGEDKREFHSLDVVDNTTILSDQEWHNIREDLLNFFNGVRAARLRREQLKRLRSRFGCLSTALSNYRRARWAPGAGQQDIGGFADYVRSPEVRAILDDPAEDIALGAITAKLSAILPEVVDAVARNRAEAFAALVRSSLDLGPNKAIAEDPLQLAVAVFRCKDCRWGSSMRWPAVLRHSHLNTSQVKEGDDYEELAYKHIWRTEGNKTVFFNEDPNSMSCLTIEPELALARDVILACGLDPNLATPAELDSCGVRLRCVLCARLVKQQAFDWLGAIRHDSQHHCEESGKPSQLGFNHWESIPEDQVARVREVEVSLRASTAVDELKRSRSLDASCSWCGAGRMANIGIVKEHLKTEHGEHNPQFDVDYCLPEQRPGIWMFSTLLSENKEAQSIVKEGKGFFVEDRQKLSFGL